MNVKWKALDKRLSRRPEKILGNTCLIGAHWPTGREGSLANRMGDTHTAGPCGVREAKQEVESIKAKVTALAVMHYLNGFQKLLFELPLTAA